ncbi:MAG: hypothetical protein IJS19_02915 [Muribaculaceae bacterium]|nr:hypothetical protein [Muribaculaceae bacterium]
MIATTDIANIIAEGCSAFGLPIFQVGNVERGEITSERIVIVPKPQNEGKFWRKCFVEVNICVPDDDIGADLQRLNELEKSAYSHFKRYTVGNYDGTPYRYKKDSIGIEEDTQMKCHYVNVRVLFESLNTKE